ncbi:MAG: SRPBCC family protein [Actinobacteria bacterium]|nr:SRPBCC family protein [Actinomycetota bacterium]
MKTLSAQTYIEAPAEKIWKIVADLGTAHLWSPNLSSVNMLSQAKSGIGSERHCDVVADGGFFRDRVTLWEEGRRIVWDVYETDAPLKSSFAVGVVPFGAGAFFDIHLTYDLLPEAANMGIPAEAMEAELQNRAYNAVYGMRTFVLEDRKAALTPLASS